MKINIINTGICSLKAFGDLTIALNAIRRVNSEDRNKIYCIAGVHHKELLNAIKPNCNIIILPNIYSGVPAFYDVRDKGIISAAKSFINAFFEFRKLELNNTQLLFDKIGVREWILSIGSIRIGLDDNCDNIYVGYKKTLIKNGFSVSDSVVKAGGGKRIIIFPNARKSFRNIPEKLLMKIISECINFGYDPVIFELDNERSLELKNVKKVRSNLSFSNTINYVNSSRAVISCDSLPVHIASYFDKPVFVVSPYNKTKYWLPENSLINNYWAKFDDQEMLIIKLSSFLHDYKFD